MHLLAFGQPIAALKFVAMTSLIGRYFSDHRHGNMLNAQALPL